MPVLKKPGFSRLQHRLQCLVGPDAPVPVPRPDRPVLDPSHWLGESPDYLGHGWVSDVWGNNEWVAKIGKEVIPEAEIMPAPDDEKRQALAEQTLEVIEGLRLSPEFAEFRHLLPETFIPAPFVIIQKRQRGLKMQDLDDQAKERAEEFRNAIGCAARRALPGVEIDVNPENLYFDSHGNPTALLDPAGSQSWATSWKPGQPVGRKTKQAAREIIARWIAMREGESFKARGWLVEIAGSFARRVTGAGVGFGDALLVASLEKTSAFLVKHAFRDAYESRSFNVTLGGKLSNALGLPVEDEREVPSNSGRWVQHFQNGMMWTQREGVRVCLRPEVSAAIPLIHRRWAEGGWKTVGPITPIGGGYCRRVRGRSLQFGDAYLVANPECGRAFVVKNEFRYAYTSVLFPESKLRPLHEVLGLPTDDERQLQDGSGRFIQHFQNGQLTGLKRRSRWLNDAFVTTLNQAGTVARNIFEAATVRLRSFGAQDPGSSKQ